MEIRIQTLKFNADKKLLDFVEKKLQKLPKYYDDVRSVEVTLSLLPDFDNKNVKMIADVPGNDLVVERNAAKFEDAVLECVDVLKDLLVKAKEKRRDK